MLTKLYVRAQNLVARDEGATAVEYGIMVAAIAAVIVAIVFLIGDEIQAAFQTVLDELIAP
jgi:pilus assembly protein Flp/PilA